MSARKCSTNGTVPVAQIRLLMPITICWFPSGAAIGQKLTTPSRGSGLAEKEDSVVQAFLSRLGT